MYNVYNIIALHRIVYSINFDTTDIPYIHREEFSTSFQVLQLSLPLFPSMLCYPINEYIYIYMYITFFMTHRSSIPTWLLSHRLKLHVFSYTMCIYMYMYLHICHRHVIYMYMYAIKQCQLMHKRTNIPATGQQEESDQTKAGMNSQYQIWSFVKKSFEGFKGLHVFLIFFLSMLLLPWLAIESLQN